MSPHATNRLPSLDEVKAQWTAVVRRYQTPDNHSIVQVLNSLLPYLALWVAMFFALEYVGLWLSLLLSIPAGLFSMRLFIIFHDCGHGSFFSSKQANNIVGFWMGVLTMTPSHHWWHSHAVHHASAADLDRRGMGDVWTLTVDEYLALPLMKRIGYRLYRSYPVMFMIAPMWLFFVSHRFADKDAGKRERNSVILTNLALVGIYGGLSLVLGWQNVLLVLVPTMSVAAIVGVWLFYVQHQFEDVYWARHEEWDYVAAAMHGSSFLQLPKVLQWFSGNIGFHHIHHLSPRIPNYFLEKAWRENPIFQIEPLTFAQAIQAMGYRLWDERREKLVGFGYINVYREKMAVQAASAD